MIEHIETVPTDDEVIALVAQRGGLTITDAIGEGDIAVPVGLWGEAPAAIAVVGDGALA